MESRPQKSSSAGNPSNWVELKEYVDVRFAELMRHYDYRLDALDSLREKQAQEFSRRISAMDETQRTKYPTRDDISQIHNRFDADIRMLRESRAAHDSTASMTSFYVTLVIAIAGLCVAVFAAIWK